MALLRSVRGPVVMAVRSTHLRSSTKSVVLHGKLTALGAITSGKDLLAAQIMGADLGYVDTPFLATQECEVDALYKQMIVAANADQIVITRLFSGMAANYLKESIARTGLDPKNLPSAVKPGVGTEGHNAFKLWKDIWAAGQGVGNIDEVTTVAELVMRLEREYRSAQAASIIQKTQ
ncbi:MULTISPECIES: nitronate monooxygenase family protein [unclassified Pseudomonas]|uniref:NAD(P)H-dependent flavin oxidoreductase n=1 Tax=unclassified Pseudomonas TaxID=196821 RepID=UPI002113B6EC|nr:MULTISPECIES: nitronate monooxygenase [unclassified Pseudomonas]